MKIFLDANICLDLLDTTRPTSTKSVDWYIKHKDNQNDTFYFSGDFITTLYYVLTERKKHSPKKTLQAIDALSCEILPHYIIHNDFTGAKSQFFDNIFNDFEDLIILNSASRLGCKKFITNDKQLLVLNSYLDIEIATP